MKENYRNFTKVLDDMFKDPQFAADFLSYALEEEDFDTFFMSLKDVIRAQGSISSIADKADISRSTLYNLFKEEANPELRTLLSVLHSLGYDLKVMKRSRNRAA